MFGLDPFSQSLNNYACYFAGFILICSVLECFGEVFVFQTVDSHTWLGRRLITGNWRHAVYVVLFYPVEFFLLFLFGYLVRRYVLIPAGRCGSAAGGGGGGSGNGSSMAGTEGRGHQQPMTNSKSTTDATPQRPGTTGGGEVVMSQTASAHQPPLGGGVGGILHSNSRSDDTAPSFLHPLVGMFVSERQLVNASRLITDLSRGLICFGLILMSHRVCSGLLSFFITIECKHIENDINIFVNKWRGFTRYTLFFFFVDVFFTCFL